MTQEIKQNINEVLHYIQTNLKAPKDKYNSFGKYNYRSAEGILEGVKNIIPEGFNLTITDEIINIGERFYIKATAKLFSYGEKNSIEVSAFARESEKKTGMDDAQLTGSCSSYARKYALNGLFCIDDTKDVDTEEFQKEKKQEQKQEDPNKPITHNQIIELGKFTSLRLINDFKRANNKPEVKSMEELTFNFANYLIDKEKENQEKQKNFDNINNK